MQDCTQSKWTSKKKKPQKLTYIHTLPEVPDVSLFSLNELGHYEPETQEDGNELVPSQDAFPPLWLVE